MAYGYSPHESYNLSNNALRGSSGLRRASSRMISRLRSSFKCGTATSTVTISSPRWPGCCALSTPRSLMRTGTNPVFTRVGDDIQLTVPVTVAEASLGAKVDVPTIDGRTQLKIPPGTQSGQKLRLRERGVESAQHPGQRGDQIVTVEVAVPHLNDERSREIMRELARLNPQDPRKALFDKL